MKLTIRHFILFCTFMICAICFSEEGKKISYDEMQISTAQTTDLADMADIETNLFKQPRSKKYFKRIQNMKGVFLYSVKYNNQVVGHFTMHILSRNYIGVSHFAIHPDFQHLGIGKFMIDDVKKRLGDPKTKKEGQFELRFQMRDQSPQAIDLYKESGLYPIDSTEENKRETGKNIKILSYKKDVPPISTLGYRNRNYFERLGVTLFDSKKEIIKKYELWKQFFYNDKDKLHLLEEAKNTLISDEKKHHYITDNQLKLTNTKNKIAPFRGNPKSFDLYEQLGVHKNAKTLAGSDLYYAAFIHHGNNPKTMEKLQLALSVLSNPNLRKQYDAIITSTQNKDKSLAVTRFLSQIKGNNSIINSNRQLKKTFKETHPYTNPRPNDSNLYVRLGLSENSSRQAIINAYIKMMQLEPIRNNLHLNKQITEAYQVLSKPAFRNTYDQLIQDNKTNRDHETRLLIDHALNLNQNQTVQAKSTTKKTDLKHMNFYERLQLSNNASESKIVGNYIKLKKQYKNDPDSLLLLRDAYRVLIYYRGDYDIILQYFKNDETLETSERETGHLIELANRSHKLNRKLNRKLNKKILNGVYLIPHYFKQSILSPLFGKAKANVVDLYSRLGVSANVTQNEIKKAYLKAYEKSWPFNKQKIKNAYLILSNPYLRNHYDQEITNENFVKNKKNMAELESTLLRNITYIKYSDEIYIDLSNIESDNIKYNQSDTFTTEDVDSQLIDDIELDTINRQIKYLDTKLEEAKGNPYFQLALIKNIESLWLTTKSDGRPVPFSQDVNELRNKAATQIIIESSNNRNFREYVENLYGNLKSGDYVKHLLETYPVAQKNYLANFLSYCGLNKK